MKRVVAGLLSVAAVTAVAAPQASANSLAARPQSSSERSTAFMRVYGPAQPPYGFVRFCETNPEHCAASKVEDIRFNATADRLSELDEINRAINHAVEPRTDLEVYGVSEHWTLPVDKGDCEDYALLKRHVLIERGWPVSSLLITVVRDEKNEGHAVLTARTAQGDFVLDNKTDQVRVWHRTPYEFVMRQSYLNPKAWVSINATHAPGPAALAGVQNER